MLQIESLPCGPARTGLVPTLPGATEGEVAAGDDVLAAGTLDGGLLDAFPEPVMIVNAQRQVVLANEKLATLAGIEVNRLLGARPGEILSCIHSAGPGGCGSSEYCAVCGAGRALADLAGQCTPQVQEYRLRRRTARGTDVMDLRVWSAPLATDQRLAVLALRDTSGEKRQALLERAFFHDLLNTAGGLQGIIDLLPGLRPDEAPEIHRLAGALAAELVDQIQFHRDLAAAERGDLELNPDVLDAVDLLERLTLFYRYHTAAAGKTIAGPVSKGPVFLRSDQVLLRRVLGNLILNALEASTPSQTISVSFENEGMPLFTVHNESWMPREVQLQVFQRSFSTKASSGRGIGTYSARLLTERYLNGSITFHSSASSGTTFYLRLPADAADWPITV